MEKTVHIYISAGSRCPKRMKRRMSYRLETEGDKKHAVVKGAIEPEATAHQAELLALAAALGHFRHPCRLVIHTGSSYVWSGLNRGWVYRWAGCGWRNSRGEPAANRTEWLAVLGGLKGMAFKVLWTKQDIEDR